MILCHTFVSRLPVSTFPTHSGSPYLKTFMEPRNRSEESIAPGWESVPGLCLYTCKIYKFVQCAVVLFIINAKLSLVVGVGIENISNQTHYWHKTNLKWKEPNRVGAVDRIEHQSENNIRFSATKNCLEKPLFGLNNKINSNHKKYHKFLSFLQVLCRLRMTIYWTLPSASTK